MFFRVSKSKVFIILLLVISSGFRYYNLGKNSLWMDEARQFREYYFAKSIKHVIIRALDQQQPPLDYFIGLFVTKTFGVSEITIRMSAFVFGSILPILVFFFVRKITDSTIAICASILIAVSAPLIQYSQEGRPYSIYFFFLFMSIASFFKLLDNQRFLDWAVYFFL
jgi:mannosyltransferase